MRVSVDKDDPGYSPASYAIIDKIYLNGIEIKHVITADDDAGVIIFYCTDENGHYIIDDDDRLMTGTLSGDVEIVFYPGRSVLDLHRIH